MKKTLNIFLIKIFFQELIEDLLSVSLILSLLLVSLYLSSCLFLYYKLYEIIDILIKLNFEKYIIAFISEPNICYYFL